MKEKKIVSLYEVIERADDSAAFENGTIRTHSLQVRNSKIVWAVSAGSGGCRGPFGAFSCFLVQRGARAGTARAQLKIVVG